MTVLADPERQLALSYAPMSARRRLSLLWQLDERMAAIVAAAREPAIGAMRLLWWRDALTRLDDPSTPVPAEPLLAAIAETLLPAGLSGAVLAELEEGWSVLLDDAEPGEEAIRHHGDWRGARLFNLSGALLGDMPDDLAAAGIGWALADLGHRISRPAAREAARHAAREALANVSSRAWGGALRPLGLLVLLAKRDAATPSGELRRQGSPARLARSIGYYIFGR